MPTFEIPHRPHPRQEGATSTSVMVEAASSAEAMAQVKSELPDGHIMLFVRRVKD